MMRIIFIGILKNILEYNMARKRRKFEMNAHPADGHLMKMKFKDLKRECVIRGMLFEDVIESTQPTLANFFRTHFYEDVQHDLLDEFDDWQEDEIKKAVLAKGGDPSDIIHPSLRLGFIAERDEDGNVTKRKRARTIVKKKKKRRERTAQGVFSGTKKALTFQLQKDGHDKKTVTKMVLGQFPDASEKSISIWFNKSKKA